MTEREALFDYLLQQGDNCLILGQRLGEWCGHGPVLEQDIAITNLALDMIGQSRSLYQYAAGLQEEEKSEDELAFLRDAWQFRNVLLVEQPNQDFAFTIVRQFFIDHFNFLLYSALTKSSDERLKAISLKAVKEVTYHKRWSTDWVLRLGDGTEESHKKINNALQCLWTYTSELFEKTRADEIMQAANIGVDLESLKPIWDSEVSRILSEATLAVPESKWMQSGGKSGRHSEHMGFILADLQFLQRAYPKSNW